jgi:hypothetical protein
MSRHIQQASNLTGLLISETENVCTRDLASGYMAVERWTQLAPHHVSSYMSHLQPNSQIRDENCCRIGMH